MGCCVVPPSRRDGIWIEYDNPCYNKKHIHAFVNIKNKAYLYLIKQYDMEIILKNVSDR
jgi:hypothetical protein